MKSLATGSISGCLVWVITFLVLTPILWLFVYMISSFMTFTEASYRVMQPVLCPANTTLKVETFDTTTTDSSHHSIGAVGHDMNCIDSDGNTLKKDVVVEYLLLWRLFGHLSGPFLAGLLAFLFAAPAGALVACFLPSRAKSQPVTPA